MKEGVLLYFSEEEFAVMMELAGGKEYTLFLTQRELDNRRLTEAFVSLFQRGLLFKAGDTFVPSEKGAFFHELRNASHVVLLRKEAPEPRTLLCYAQEETLWNTEVLDGSPRERYRLSMRRSREMAKWLFETGFLPRPLLKDEDTKELKLLFADELSRDPEGGAIARIQRYSGGGVLQREYALHSGRAGQLLRESDSKKTEIRFYTKETLDEMLRHCFGG